MMMSVKPAQMWCDECQQWTDVHECDELCDDPDGGFGCAVCHEWYKCQECGYEVDRSGTCQRPDGCGAGDLTWSDNPISEYRKAHPEKVVWTPDKGWSDAS